MCGCDYCANKSRYPVSGCDCYKCKSDRWTPGMPGQTDVTLEAGVTEALGAASACWENLSGAGVFQDQKALWVLDGLMKFIIDKTDGVPNLGMATTGDLLRELQSRAILGGYYGYRTVDN